MKLNLAANVLLIDANEITNSKPIPVAIKAYSIAVAPSLFSEKLLTLLLKKLLTLFFICLAFGRYNSAVMAIYQSGLE